MQGTNVTLFRFLFYFLKNFSKIFYIFLTVVKKQAQW